MPKELSAADRLEIKEIFAHWGIDEDTGQSEAWADLFTSEGVSVSGRGDVVVGHDALVAASRSRWAKPDSRRCNHWMGEPVIFGTDDGALARHYAMVVERTEDGYEARSVSERTYELRQVNGRWLVQSRTITFLAEDQSMPPLP